MRIRHRYGLSSSNNQALRFLRKQKVPYQSDELVVTVEVYEDEAHFDNIERFMHKIGALDVRDTIYQQTELENAEWLLLRCEWWSQYPEPREDRMFVFTTYDTTDYCPGIEKEYYCGMGLSQAQPFMIEKEPNWGARNFMMLNWVADELFISKKAHEILKKSDLVGVTFWDVVDKRNRELETIKQIHVEAQIPKGLDLQCIDQVFMCPRCGVEKFMLKAGPIRMRKELFCNLKNDVVKTTEKFGEIGCDSMILVSQKFYDIVRKNGLDRGLAFEPIELI